MRTASCRLRDGEPGYDHTLTSSSASPSSSSAGPAGNSAGDVTNVRHEVNSKSSPGRSLDAFASERGR